MLELYYANMYMYNMIVAVGFRKDVLAFHFIGRAGLGNHESRRVPRLGKVGPGGIVHNPWAIIDLPW
jgi:hypothetical protein